MGQKEKTILVVDDEASLCEMLEVAVRKWGYKIQVARTLKDAKSRLERRSVDLVLSDIKLPDGSGVDLLERVKTLPERPPVLLMTAFGSTEAAVRAMKLGAFYYITKPFKLEEVRLLIERALEGDTLKKENLTLKAEVKKEFSIENIIGKAKPMKALFEMIERVRDNKTNVLITGESGTGKELVARAIHYGGILKNKPFVAVNCGAIPETLIESELFGHKRGSFTGAVAEKDGLFRVADGGTIFLDEIGELPMGMQVKLLRVLQDRTFRPVGGNESIKVDVRVIAATNRDLEKEIAKGKFREDLYYRLNVINIRAPALRERKEDIPEMVAHFLRKFSLGIGKTIDSLSAPAARAVLAYDFPGNVRELENMMERAVALEGTDEITLESLPHAIQVLAAGAAAPEKGAKGALASKEARAGASKPQRGAKAVSRKELWEQAAGELESGNVDLDEIVGELEREFISRALEKSGGVKKKAAEALGITFRSIRYRIAKLGIEDVEEDSDET